MLHRLAFLLALPAFVLLPARLVAAGAASAPPATSSAQTSARVIVQFKAASSLLAQPQALTTTARHAAMAESLGRRAGLPLRSGIGITDRTQVVMADNIDARQLAARLARQPDVEYAVVDELRHRAAAPNDPLYPNGLGGAGPAVGQWYLRAPAGAVQSSIDIERAWAVTPGSNSIVVAVLDTGVRFDHADLAPVSSGGSLLPGYDMISDAQIANDGDGRDTDASDSGDWVTTGERAQAGGPFAQCDVENSSWHGTQVAGIIAALTNNGIGMASLGRGNVRVLPVRVLGKCGGYDSDIMAGMLWAAGIATQGAGTNPNPAKVINLSLGGEGACNQAYQSVISQVSGAGAIVVSSAGNTAGHAPSVPANCPGVIAVAGLRHVGTKVGFSDLGSAIALSAPAGNCINTLSNQPCLYPILTTSNAGTTTPVANNAVYTDSNNPSLGTSFSAPMVSGTIALMLSVDPSLTSAQVRAILTGSARPFPTTGGDNGDGTPVRRCVAPNGSDQAQCHCTTATCGAGMLDAGAALTALQTGVQAQIGFSKTGAIPGQALALSGTGSWVTAGRSIAGYQWTLVDGGGIVSALTGAATDSSVVVTPSSAGRFTVSLVVTDDLGNMSTTSQIIDVVVPPVPPATGGGGGGGSLELASLWGLAAALAAALLGGGMARRRATRLP